MYKLSCCVMLADKKQSNRIANLQSDAVQSTLRHIHIHTHICLPIVRYIQQVCIFDGLLTPFHAYAIIHLTFNSLVLWMVELLSILIFSMISGICNTARNQVISCNPSQNIRRVWWPYTLDDDFVEINAFLIYLRKVHNKASAGSSTTRSKHTVLPIMYPLSLFIILSGECECFFYSFIKFIWIWK